MENVCQRKLLAGHRVGVRGRQHVEGCHGGQDVLGLGGKVGRWSGAQALPTALFSLGLTFFLVLSELMVRLSLPEGWVDCPMKVSPSSTSQISSAVGNSLLDSSLNKHLLSTCGVLRLKGAGWPLPYLDKSHNLVETET